MRMLSVIALSLALGYALLVLAMYLGQSRLLFLPHLPGRELAATPASIGLPYQDLRIATADGETLHGWFVAVANARHTVLFLHGNAGNISHRLDTLALLARLETSVLIVDYRGYGESTGKPSEAGSYLDADAAWDYLTAERGIDPAQIVVFGRSLGGAVAIALAARRPAAALIVEAGFTSVPDLAARLYPWLPVRWLARIHYPSRQRIASIGCPLLLLHSRDDEIVPFSHARALFEAAVPPRTLVALRGGHNDAFMVSATRYSDALRQFLDGL